MRFHLNYLTSAEALLFSFRGWLDSKVYNRSQKLFESLVNSWFFSSRYLLSASSPAVTASQQQSTGTVGTVSCSCFLRTTVNRKYFMPVKGSAGCMQIESETSQFRYHCVALICEYLYSCYSQWRLSQYSKWSLAGFRTLSRNLVPFWDTLTYPTYLQCQMIGHGVYGRPISF